MFFAHVYILKINVCPRYMREGVSYPNIPYAPPRTELANHSIKPHARRQTDGQRLFTVKEHMQICNVIKRLYPAGVTTDSARSEQEFVENVALSVPFFMNVSKSDVILYFESLGFAVPPREDMDVTPPPTPTGGQTEFFVRRGPHDNPPNKDYDVIVRSMRVGGSHEDVEVPGTVDSSVPRLGRSALRTAATLRRQPTMDIPKRVATAVRMLKSRDHESYIETLFRVYELMRSRKVPARIETDEVLKLYQRATPLPRIHNIDTGGSGPSYESLVPIVAGQLDPSLPRPVQLSSQDLLFQTILQAIAHVEEYRLSLFVRLCYRDTHQPPTRLTRACFFCEEKFSTAQIKSHCLQFHRTIFNTYEDFLVHKDHTLNDPSVTLDHIIDLINRTFASENEELQAIARKHEDKLYNNAPTKYFTFWCVPTVISRNSYARLFENLEVIRDESSSSTSSSDSSSETSSSDDSGTTSSDDSSSSSGGSDSDSSDSSNSS
jgi:hypothetical protein